MANSKKKKIERGPRGLVLAEGEVTGHAHVIRSHNAELYEDGNVKFLTTFAPIEIEHEEHETVKIEEKGDYTIGIVKEWNHLEQEAQKVRD